MCENQSAIWPIWRYFPKCKIYTINFLSGALHLNDLTSRHVTTFYCMPSPRLRRLHTPDSRPHRRRGPSITPMRDMPMRCTPEMPVYRRSTAMRDASMRWPQLGIYRARSALKLRIASCARWMRLCTSCFIHCDAKRMRLWSSSRLSPTLWEDW